MKVVCFIAFILICSSAHASIVETDCPPPLECTVTYGEEDAVNVEPLKVPVSKPKKKLPIDPPGKSVLVRGTDIIELRELAHAAAIEVPTAVPLSDKRELSPRESHFRPRKAVKDSGFRFKEVEIE